MVLKYKKRKHLFTQQILSETDNVTPVIASKTSLKKNNTIAQNKKYIDGDDLQLSN